MGTIAPPEIIKPGYKQTDVGIIPEDWKVEKLRDLTTLMTNGFVGKATPHYTAADDGVIYIQGFNVEESSFNFSGIKSVTRRFHNQHLKSCLREGDLLTIQTGEIGLTTIVPKHLEGSNCHALVISRFKKESYESKYFAYYFNSFAGRRRFKDIETGSTMKHLNVGDMLDLYVPHPPTKSEQRAIATTLSDVDALIASLDEVIAKKRDLKQAAMQQLLTGKRRLPGFSGEWDMRSIGSFSAFVTKGATPTTYGFTWQRDGVLFLRSECVSDDGLDLAQSMFVSEAAHVALIRGEVRSGDILMTITGNVGRVVYLKPEFGFANINQHIARIRVKDPSVLSDFVYQWLSQPSVRAYYTSITTGQAYPQISLKQVRETQIPLPYLQEQTAIATILSDMDAELTELAARRDKTRALKQGMMQQLLTGNIRLR